MIEKIFPNVLEFAGDMVVAFKETVIMVLIAGAIGLLAGLILAIILVITREGGLYENKVVHRILETIINIFRSDRKADGVRTNTLLLQFSFT